MPNKALLILGAAFIGVIAFGAFRQGQAQAKGTLRFVVYPHPIDPTDLAVSEWSGGIVLPWRDGSVVVEQLRTAPSAIVEIFTSGAPGDLARQFALSLEALGHQVAVDAAAAVPHQPPPAPQFG